MLATRGKQREAEGSRGKQREAERKQRETVGLESEGESFRPTR